jgi:SAM-dependent methyltransferase
MSSNGSPALLAECILCGAPNVEVFLDLGDMALANNFLTRDQLTRPEPKAPLRVGFCHSCTHVQLADRVPPPAMFDTYLYLSGMSDTLKRHLRELAWTLVDRLALAREDLVVDIGSNDGSLLSYFKQRGLRTLGVDPAANLAPRAAEVGVTTHTAFFGSRTAEEIVRKYGRAALITTTNTFPHIPALADFLQGIDTLLAPDGTLVIEAHYLPDLLEQYAFDTVYHEHVSYWSLGPMVALLHKHGLEVVDAERLPIHHGQIRVFVRRRDAAVVCERVAALTEAEERAGLRNFDTFKHFARQIGKIEQSLHEGFVAFGRDGKRVVGYGAPAKGNTLLGYLKFGTRELAYLADRSPLKQGLYAPGVHIPIVSTDRILVDQPDYLLILAWNFAEEIMSQQAEYRRRGGRFILPLPAVRIVG